VKRVALLLALAGCASAVKHPALAAGIAGGVVGFSACEIDNVDTKTCAIVAGSTALFLGGIAWLVTTIFDTEDHELTGPDDEAEAAIRNGALKVDTQSDLPPGLPPDAGISPDALPAGDAPSTDAPRD